MSELTARSCRYDYPVHISYKQEGQPWCDSAATAFMMYKIGADESLWDPRAIDVISCRTKNNPTEDFTPSRLALLAQGAEMVEIRDFDYRIYIIQGRKYLNQYHAKGWRQDDPKGFDAYWTNERLKADIASCNNYTKQVDKYKGQLTEKFDIPTINDVQTLTDNGFVVRCSWGGGSVTHSIVVTEVVRGEDNERRFTVFDNRLQPIPFHCPPEEFFTMMVKLDDGIVAVRQGDR